MNNSGTALNFTIKRPVETSKPEAASDTDVITVDDTSDSPAVPYTSAAPARAATASTPAATTTSTTTPVVTAPNTGENTRLSFSSTTNSSANFLPIVFIIFAVLLLTAFIYRSKKSHLNFSKNNFQVTRSPFVLSLSIAGILAVAFLSGSLFSRQSVDSDLNVSSASQLALATDSAVDTDIDEYLDSKDVAYMAVARVAVQTSSSYDYHLSMRAETDKLYLNGNKTSQYYFEPVKSGSKLNTQDNTWGYNTIQNYIAEYCDENTIGEDLSGCDTTKFTAVPTTDKEILKNNTSVNPFLIFFAVNPGDNLPNGTYSTKIIYTLVSDEPATSAESTEVVDPSNPTDPTNPTDETDPTNPTDETDPTDPTDETDPTNPTEETTPDCIITATNPCDLKDGKTWILGNNGHTLTWNDMFSSNGTNGSLKPGICPSGYAAPKITDYDALIQAYGGTAVTEIGNNERAGYRLDGSSTLFKIFGGEDSTGNRAFWSSTERNSLDAYYMSTIHNYGGATSAPSHAKSIDYHYAACYKNTD